VFDQLQDDGIYGNDEIIYFSVTFLSTVVPGNQAATPKRSQLIYRALIIYQEKALPPFSWPIFFRQLPAIGAYLGNLIGGESRPVTCCTWGRLDILDNINFAVGN
jgi:hypothetical protein